MENDSKIREWLNSLTESLNEQQWYQEIKSKWEELDPQSRTYLKFLGFGAGVLSILILIFSSIWSVHRLKVELSEKRALLNTLQAANDELSRLKEFLPNLSGREKESEPWINYLESLAFTSGVDKANISISPEKPGQSGELSKEFLFDVSIKHANIKQIIRYALALENGKRPVKLRNLLIDTKGESTGYLDAVLAISGFTLLEPK